MNQYSRVPKRLGEKNDPSARVLELYS